MNKWINKIDQFNPNNLFGLIVATSILLAAWMQYIQHGWITRDSLLYLEQARLFALGDWQGVKQVFSWPLYGVCIGIVHKLTSFSIHGSAQILNMLFFGIATASFLQIIKLAGGSNRTLVSGALLLFSAQYIVGDVLEMLMRDEGFWAFYLTSLVFFIRYDQQQKLRDAVLWQICIIVATLFRIEAILYLLFLPLFFMFGQLGSITSRFKKMFNAYSISTLVAIFIGITLVTQPQISMAQFGRLQEVFTINLYQELSQKLLFQADIMSTQVLGDSLEEFAIPGLLLTFLYAMGAKIITATGLIGTGLAAFYFKYSPTSMQPAIRKVLLAIGIIAFITMALIITKVFVLSSRYVVALAWILLIFAAFYLAELSSNNRKKHRYVFIALCLLLCLGFIKNILPKQAGYNYRQEAVAWVKSHNDDGKPVFYDETRMIYYSNQAFTGTSGNTWQITSSAIKNKSIHNNKFLVISYSKKHSERFKYINENLPEFIEIKRFSNRKRKKHIVIYERLDTPPH